MQEYLCHPTKGLHQNHFDICVTSPPYWDILNMKRSADQKDAVNYSNKANDVGNIANYNEFIDTLSTLFSSVNRVLKKGGYCIVNVMDIRKKSNFYPLHSDLATALQKVGFIFDDLIAIENGDENKPVTYHVNHDATIIEKNGTELIIAPRDTQFNEAKVWQKLATNFAGPFMNILLGFVVFLIWTFTVPGPATTTIQSTTNGSPAQIAKIEPGDRIVAVNGQKINSFEQVTEKVNQSKGKSLKFELSKDGSTKTVIVKPKAHRIQKQKIYQIGIVAKSNENAGVKLKRGWDTAVSTTGLIFNAVGNLFRHFSLNKLSGPVGIYSQTSQVSQMGFTYVLAFLAMISINLGIVNLIPIPGLDGGKLLLNLIELVRGKPISEEHEAIVELIGFGLLLVLIIAVTGNDIYRYFIK